MRRILVLLICILMVACGAPEDKPEPEPEDTPAIEEPSETEPADEQPVVEEEPEVPEIEEPEFNLAAGDPEIGREYVFSKSRGRCLSCHRIKGEGNPEGFILDDAGLRHDKQWLAEFIENPRNLRPEVVSMPPWRGDDVATIADVVAYLSTLKLGVDHKKPTDEKPESEPDRYEGDIGGWSGYEHGD